MKLNTTQNVCRTCLTEEGSFQSIFVKESSSGVSKNISEMLSACTTIQLKEGDGLPDQICSECSEQTVKLYSFKLRCERSDVILRQRLEKRKAESVKIKNKCNADSIKEKLLNYSKNDEFKYEIDEEMWRKISNETFKEESKTKESESDFCQNELLTSQEIVKDIKLEIIEEDIEITYNSISPLLMESKESLFSSPECDIVIFEKENLEKRITELNIKKEPKVSCDKNLKRKQQLIKINSFLKNNQHGCNICFKGFSQISELKEHMKTHTLTSKQTVLDKQPSISNVVCDKGFYKSYECDVCKKSFKFSSDLMRHKRIHTGEKPYECKVCKKKFNQLIHLTKHKRIHTGEKPFKCKTCKKEFTYSSGLKSHEIYIHTNEKPYKCEVCKKGFKQLVDLKRHKRIHRGEKDEICESSFVGFAQK